MARRSMINRGSEVRVKGKSIGRDSSGVGARSFRNVQERESNEAEGALGTFAMASAGEGAVFCEDMFCEDVCSQGAFDEEVLSEGFRENRASACGSDIAARAHGTHLGGLFAKLRAFNAQDKQAILALTGRVALMLVGIAVMALGIDVVVKANLGNSPISAFPYVMSHVTPNISFGTLMLLWQCFLVLLQIVILRRDFRLVDLLQIPISVFFGVCIDAFAAVIAPITLPNLMSSWACLLIGMAILALGVTMTVISATVMNCGEAVVQAVVKKTGIRFGTMKVIFDVSCAVAAAALGLLCLGHLEGVREGTVVCAVFTGLLVNAYMGLYHRVRNRAQ